MTRVQKVGMVIHQVDELETAVAFYRDALGLELEFRDGDRFAALSAGPTTIALAAGDERLHERALVSYRVDDVDAVARALVAAGARMVREAEDGPHERRAVLLDPAGNPLALYAPLG
jgi:predicted enzyme related to lactoylglutathione lyase